MYLAAFFGLLASEVSLRPLQSGRTRALAIRQRAFRIATPGRGVNSMSGKKKLAVARAWLSSTAKKTMVTLK